MLGSLNRGGAESLVLDVCKNLMHSSFDCLCIYRKEGNMSEDFHKSDVRILHIPKKRSMLAYMWHMRKLLQDEKVDIVHSQTPSNSLLLSFILFGTGIKLITTIHGFSFLVIIINPNAMLSPTAIMAVYSLFLDKNLR